MVSCCTLLNLIYSPIHTPEFSQFFFLPFRYTVPFGYRGKGRFLNRIFIFINEHQEGIFQ